MWHCKSTLAAPQKCGDPTTLPILPLVMIQTIMEYLAPADLLKFCFLSKEMQSFVSIAAVVRSALLSGGNAKKTVDELFSLIQNKSIYPPSPLRLLRLVNGKVCEFCGKNKCQAVRKAYGVYACWHCTTKRRMSKAFRKGGPIYDDNKEVCDAIFDSKRVTKKMYWWREVTDHIDILRGIKRARKYRIESRLETRFDPETQQLRNTLHIRDFKNYLWRKPTFAINEEMIGPIITYSHIDGMIGTVNAFIADLGITAVHAVELYFVGTQPAHYEDMYQEFIDAYKSHLKVSEERHRYRKWKKVTSSCDWKTERMANTIKILNTLQALVSHPGARELICYEVNKAFWVQDKQYKKVPCVVFRNKWVQALIQRNLRAPSKTTKGALVRVARKIDEFWEQHVAYNQEPRTSEFSDIPHWRDRRQRRRHHANLLAVNGGNQQQNDET